MKRAMLNLCVAFALCGAAPAHAQWKPGEEPPLPEAARPALGTWLGSVSWNDPPMSYAWDIYPDGGFSSGRLGRGAGGGGHWSIDGAHLSLKYDDGFRYDGEISGDVFSGIASRPDGTRVGEFWMNRAPTKPAPLEEAP